MANGIESQYTGIGRVPYVREQERSTITDLAQLAAAYIDRQDAKNLEREKFQAEKEYKQGQINVAKERNQIAKMEFEKRKADENEREQVATIQQITDDYKEQVKQYRALAESTGKNSYNMLADNIESRGIAKDSIEPIKQNLMQENNPYKIREYLRQNGEELDKYFPRASAQLNRRADKLEADYKVSDKEVLDSEVYKMQVEQINREMRNTDGTLRDGYTLEQYGRNMNQAKMNAEITLEATSAPPGVAPVSEEDISMIWDNPEARDAWLTNPLDYINEIKKKYGMVETEEDDLGEDKDDEEVSIPSVKEIEKEEIKARADSYKNMDQLKDEIDNLVSKKNILLRLEKIGRLNENQAKELIKIDSLINKSQADLKVQKKISQAGMKRREAATGRYFR